MEQFWHHIWFEFAEFCRTAHRRVSTLLALFVWGCSAFSCQPNFASFLVHFGIIPSAMFIMLFVAFYEGSNTDDPT